MPSRSNTTNIAERARRRRKKKILRALVKGILYAITILSILAVILAIIWVITLFTGKGSDKAPDTEISTEITDQKDTSNTNSNAGANTITNLELNEIGSFVAAAGETNNTSAGTVHKGVITYDDPSVYAQYMNSGHTVNVAAGSYGSYSREFIPYGFGSKYDENNRPSGIGYYTTRYSKYGADYIMPESKYVWLTMDDGYEAGTTEDILNTLKEKNVPCVFFLTKPYCQEEPELVKRMIADGHVIGNHTTTHPAGGIQAYSSDKIYADIKECSDYIESNFGYKPYLFRFPEGAASEQALAVVQSLNMRSVFWSFAYKDWVLNAQPDVSTSLKNALDRVHGGAIILLHAESRTNADMLADYIDGVRAKGFEFGYYTKMD